MKLVVGLGNPGAKYDNDRHNVGFILLDKLLLAKNLTWTPHNNFDSIMCKDEDVIYLKPQTFMNDSGVALSKAVNFYKIPLENITIINDDMDLPFGTVKKQLAAGAAGHHGVESIIAALGSQNFWRLRVGIGRPEDKTKNVGFLLTPFTANELAIIREINIAEYLN
jgi:PTH1 family peptidyl-tRNA hydrolase